MTMTDERLDRLVHELLTDRAEDMAAAALPAEEILNRLAARVGPAYRRPFALRGVQRVLLVLVVLALTAGIVGALAFIGFRPTPLADGRFECAAHRPAFPESVDDELYLIRLHDITGLVTGCRQVGFEEREAAWDKFGIPDSLDLTTVNVMPMAADGARLMVTWVTYRCDENANLRLTGSGPTEVRLAVDQERYPPCTPGTAAVSIEVTFKTPVSPEDVATVIRRVETDAHSEPIGPVSE